MRANSSSFVGSDISSSRFGLKHPPTFGPHSESATQPMGPVADYTVYRGGMIVAAAIPVIFLRRRGPMTAIHERNHRFGFRAFMLKHQYKVMAISLVIGFMWVGM
jgi:hypothetical protein